MDIHDFKQASYKVQITLLMLLRVEDSAQNLPKFQIPYLTPKSVQTC
jgi:hypothetical protein